MIATHPLIKRKVCPSCGFALGPGAYQQRKESCDSCIEQVNRIRPWEPEEIVRMRAAMQGLFPLWALYMDMWREEEHALWREAINAYDRRRGWEG